MPRTAALALASLLTACGPATADTATPEPPTPQRTAQLAEPDVADTTDEPIQASEDRPGVQTIKFDGDEPEPPTDSVRAAPKRPPIPRFQLFGTRPTDGP
jgi:hypothetical protein